MPIEPVFRLSGSTDVFSANEYSNACLPPHLHIFIISSLQGVPLCFPKKNIVLKIIQAPWFWTWYPRKETCLYCEITNLSLASVFSTGHVAPRDGILAPWTPARIWKIPNFLFYYCLFIYTSPWYSTHFCLRGCFQTSNSPRTWNKLSSSDTTS